MGMGTTSEKYFRMFFMSDEKHKVQDSNEASYTFRKDKYVPIPLFVKLGSLIWLICELKFP